MQLRVFLKEPNQLYPLVIPGTPLKTNMSPENQWLEDVFPTKVVPF